MNISKKEVRDSLISLSEDFKKVMGKIKEGDLDYIRNNIVEVRKTIMLMSATNSLDAKTSLPYIDMLVSYDEECRVFNEVEQTMLEEELRTFLKLKNLDYEVELKPSCYAYEVHIKTKYDKNLIDSMFFTNLGHIFNGTLYIERHRHKTYEDIKTYFEGLVEEYEFRIRNLKINLEEDIVAYKKLLEKDIDNNILTRRTMQVKLNNFKEPKSDEIKEDLKERLNKFEKELAVNKEKLEKVIKDKDKYEERTQKFEELVFQLASDMHTPLITSLISQKGHFEKIDTQELYFLPEEI